MLSKKGLYVVLGYLRKEYAMKEMYDLVKGDLESFEEDAKEVLSISDTTLKFFCEAILCKAMDECGMEDEDILKASIKVFEFFEEIGEERENQVSSIASLLEWRFIHGFEVEEEKEM